MQYQKLFTRIKNLVAAERRIGIEILECLYEIEKRKAYAELKYDGLYTFCIKELKFTDAQAYQRIQAMRALKEMPEIGPMIEAGTLNVTTVSKVQVLFRKQKKEGIRHTPESKFEVFKMVENKSTKEADQIVCALQGKKIFTRLTIELDEETEALWKKFKALSAHRNQHDDLKALRELLELGIAKSEAAIKSVKPKPIPPVRNLPSVKTADQMAEKRREMSQTPNVDSKSNQRRAVPLTIRNDQRGGDSASAKPVTSRYIPAELKRIVFKRDLYRCTNCKSQDSLQIDHIVPFALGGKTNESNLRLLCRSCNLHFAVKVFGTRATQREMLGPH